MASVGDPQIASWFPELQIADYEETSKEDLKYNCFAWAAGDSTLWWEAVRGPGYYWPDDVPWDDLISTAVLVLGKLGYEACESDSLENGFEKVAIYGRDDVYEHLARQLADGKWTSKLGYYKDISHRSLGGLVSKDYGEVVKILRRRKT